MSLLTPLQAFVDDPAAWSANAEVGARTGEAAPLIDSALKANETLAGRIREALR